MSAPLPPEDRDLRAAHQLDAGETGDDALLRTIAPLRTAAEPDPEAAERVWAGVEAAMRTEHAEGNRVDRRQLDGRPAVRAGDRAPAPRLRLVRRRALAWAAALVVAVGAGLWFVQRSPEAIVEAGPQIAEVAGPDGSTIVLRPHSRLTRLDGAGRTYGLEGEAYFAVTSDPDAPFTVTTASGRVRVLGTRFDVSTWGDRTTVFVGEGRVELAASTAGAAVELAAGQAAWADGASVARDPSVTAATALDWRTGELVFASETAERVARELAHHLGRPIVLSDAVARETISGTLALDGTALDQLGRVLGGTFSRGPEGEAVFSR